MTISVFLFLPVRGGVHGAGEAASRPRARSCASSRCLSPGIIQGSRARPSAAGMDRGVVPAEGEGGPGSHDVDGRDGRAGEADSDDLEAGTGGPANAGNSDTCAGPGVQHACGNNEQAAGQAQAARRGEESSSALAAAPVAGRGEEASSAGACAAGTISVSAQSCLPEALRNKDESMMVLERDVDHLVCLLCSRFCHDA